MRLTALLVIRSSAKLGHRLTMYMHSTKSNRSKYVNCSFLKLTLYQVTGITVVGSKRP